MRVLSEDYQQNVEKFLEVVDSPYTDFKPELEFERLHNTKLFKTSSYENESVCREFVQFISKSISRRQKVNLKRLTSLVSFVIAEQTPL